MLHFIFQQSADAKVEALEGSLARLKAQVDDLTRQLNDANNVKARLTKENFDLQHQAQELDSANAALAKSRQQLQTAVDDLKRQLDDETRVRLSSYRNNHKTQFFSQGMANVYEFVR